MKLFFIPGTISAKDLRDEVTTLSAIGLTKDKIKKAELKSPAYTTRFSDLPMLFD